MKLSNLAIIMLVLTTVVVGTYSLVNDLSSATGVTVDPSYELDFALSKANLANASQSFSRLQNFSASTSGVFIVTLVPEALSLVKTYAILPFTVGSEFIKAITRHMALPDWMFSLIIGILTILVLFAVITLILRYPS